MANYQIIKRLEILIQLLKNHPYRTKEELIKRLNTDYDLPVTPRTLERDFSALSTDFGIEVQYDRRRNGYAISEADNDRVSNFLQFAGRIYLGELLKEGLKEFNDLRENVILEDGSGFEGVQLIQPFLLAISKKREVQFVHENYQKGTHSNYRITPLQLREYQGRWYIVGVPKGGNHIKTFGIERVSGLEILGFTKIKTSAYSLQLEKFDSIIGLNYDEAKEKELIELAVSGEQYKYLKTLPLHPTQQFESDMSGGRVKISLYLFPNYELKMQLLRLGDKIEVLAPKSLRKEIRNTLHQALKKYENE